MTVAMEPIIILAISGLVSSIAQPETRHTIKSRRSMIMRVYSKSPKNGIFSALLNHPVFATKERPRGIVGQLAVDTQLLGLANAQDDTQV